MKIRKFFVALACLLALPTVAQAQFKYTTNNGAVTITGYAFPGPEGALIIPNEINGLPVTAIGAGAFVQTFSLTSVTIPDGVTNIGDEAFQFCGLTNVTFPDTVTSIGNYACYGCGFTSVAIPTSVTSVGDYAFFECPLTSVTIPDSLTFIGDKVFDGCLLTNVTIPNSVTSIGGYAFFKCPLTSVTIPSSVTSVEDGAFMGCTNLTSVYFEGNAPSFGWQFPIFGGAGPGPFDPVTVYYLPGTRGWPATSVSLGVPQVLWNPQMQPGSVSVNPFGFGITATNNFTVVVEATTGLANSTWIPLATNTLTPGSLYFTDPQWTNYPARFYRLRWP